MNLYEKLVNSRRPKKDQPKLGHWQPLPLPTKSAAPSLLIHVTQDQTTRAIRADQVLEIRARRSYERTDAPSCLTVWRPGGETVEIWADDETETLIRLWNAALTHLAAAQSLAHRSFLQPGFHIVDERFAWRGHP